MKIAKISMVILIALSLLLSISISLSYPIPIARDFHDHLTIAKLYAEGQNALAHEDAISINNMPYPPLLHLLFVPFIWLGIIMEFGRFLQCLFFPLALFSSMYVVYKNHGLDASTCCGLLLLSSIAFYDRAIQVIPQAVDMICFPLAVHFYLNQKMGRGILGFVIASLIMIYTHGLIACFLFLPFILHELVTFKPTKTSFWVLQTLFLSLPIIVLTSIYLIPGLQYHLGGIQNPQEIAILRNPVMFTFWYLGPAICLSLPLILRKPKDVSLFQKITYYTLVSLTPMILFWPDRFLTYITMPLSILISERIPKIKNRYVEAFYVAIIASFATITYLTQWNILLTRSHHIYEG